MTTPTQSEGTERERVLISESKLVKPVRIDPVEEDRIQVLLNRARQEATVSKSDVPTESSIIRQALRLGLAELEKQRFQR